MFLCTCLMSLWFWRGAYQVLGVFIVHATYMMNIVCFIVQRADWDNACYVVRKVKYQGFQKGCGTEQTMLFSVSAKNQSSPYTSLSNGHISWESFDSHLEAMMPPLFLPWSLQNYITILKSSCCFKTFRNQRANNVFRFMYFDKTNQILNCFLYIVIYLDCVMSFFCLCSWFTAKCDIFFPMSEYYMSILDKYTMQSVKISVYYLLRWRSGMLSPCAVH